MKKRMVIMLLAVGLFFGAVFGWKAFVGYQIGMAMQSSPMPPVTVSTIQVTADTWAPTIAAVGSLRAGQGVDIAPQVGGRIAALHFESGDTVAAGDLLVQQYVADEQAQLEGLQAERRLAELNFKRADDLHRKKLISDFDFDSSETDLQRATAAVDELRLRVDKKTIRAPFAGRLGIRKVDLGQYLEPGDTIARLEASNVMLLDFPVPQRRVGDIVRDQLLSLRVDAWPGQRFNGKISAIEPQIQRDTRNLNVRATVDNRSGKLVPGMFAHVEIELPVLEQIVTVPQAAIVYSPYGDAVFVVEEQTGGGKSVTTVASRFVVVGATRGDQIMIESGLEPGAIIVSSGQQKLRNGVAVAIDNTVAVSNDPNPLPANN